MSKKSTSKTTVSEAPAHLRELAWKIQGLAHLIAHQDPSAVPSQEECYGVGQLLVEIGAEIEELSTRLEGTSDKKGSHETK